MNDLDATRAALTMGRQGRDTCSNPPKLRFMQVQMPKNYEIFVIAGQMARLVFTMSIDPYSLVQGSRAGYNKDRCWCSNEGNVWQH